LKLAFSNLACPAWTVEEAADAAFRLGFAGLELRLLDGEVIDPTADTPKVAAAVAACRERGVEVCAFDSSCRFNRADAADRARQLEELLAWIELARTLRVPVIRVFGGETDADDGASETEQNERVAEALRRAAPQAERAGVTVGLETHDAFSSARRVASVLSGVASSRIGALWDSHHPYRSGESVAEVIELLWPRIAHVHVKDAYRPGPEADWRLVLLGEGEVPVAAQLEALARAGYEGYVSLEWEKKWHPEIADPEVALPQAAAWLKQHLLRQEG
jgi:fatty-acyl-CoA synthase